MNIRFKNYLDGLTPAKKNLAMEAVKEYLAGESESVQSLVNPMAVYELCKDLSLEDEEHSVVLLCNNNLNLIKKLDMCKGTQTETLFDIRAIIREALLAKATAIYLVHNHPSGSLRPSRFDDDLTRDVRKACEYMRLKFIDHVIICNGTYYSYGEQGRLQIT